MHADTLLLGERLKKIKHRKTLYFLNGLTNASNFYFDLNINFIFFCIF